MRQTHSWSGHWPTEEFPPNGTRLRYQLKGQATIQESTVLKIWCGVEPVIVLANGDYLVPAFDPYEVVDG